MSSSGAFTCVVVYGLAQATVARVVISGLAAPRSRRRLGAARRACRRPVASLFFWASLALGLAIAYKQDYAGMHPHAPVVRAGAPSGASS
jgi:hypothetical protein